MMTTSERLLRLPESMYPAQPADVQRTGRPERRRSPGGVARVATQHARPALGATHPAYPSPTYPSPTYPSTHPTRHSIDPARVLDLLIAIAIVSLIVILAAGCIAAAIDL